MPEDGAGKIRCDKNELNRLYERYNRREFVHPDPLEFLYHYDRRRDMEVAGMIASCLAYGNVKQILKSVAVVLAPLGASPYVYLLDTPADKIVASCRGFVHRFAKGSNLAALLLGIKHILGVYGSLYQCFLDGFSLTDETVLPALNLFAGKIICASGNGAAGHLIPYPEKGSACKRLNLFLRWMVRKDRVDPGGWDDVPASKLLVPLDTHMHRIAQCLGLTARKQANLPTVLEVTAGFRRIMPEDPVKYDFALTRFGIRDDLNGFDAFEFQGMFFNNF